MSRMRRWGLMVGLGVTFITVGSVIGLVSPLRAAQGTGWSTPGDEEPGPLERIAVRPTLDAPAPRRTLAVDPVWSDASIGYRFRTHVVIDAAGHVAEARLVGAPATSALPLDVLPQLDSARAAAMDAVRQWQFEPPTVAPMLIVTDVMVSGSSRATELFPRMPAGSTTRAAAMAPLRVGGNIAPPRKLFDVAPTYPQVAMDAKVQGVVILEATIDAEGMVSDARVLRSIPLLDAAALAAVGQWRYTPTWLNGEPVPVIVTITVNFTLQ